MESDKTSSGDGMRSELLSASGWKDYELLDSGRFEKLERFGRYVLARPEPQAVWDRSLSEDEWRARADAVFRRDGRSGERGEWTLRAGFGLHAGLRVRNRRERDGGNRGDMPRRDVPECRRPILRRLCVLCTDYDRTLYVCRPVRADPVQTESRQIDSKSWQPEPT